MSQIKLELSPFWTDDLELNALTMIMVNLAVRYANIDYNKAVDLVSDKLSRLSTESITELLDNYYNKHMMALDINTWTLVSRNKK
jgi:hypothetical protein